MEEVIQNEYNMMTTRDHVSNYSFYIVTKWAIIDNTFVSDRLLFVSYHN